MLPDGLAMPLELLFIAMLASRGFGITLQIGPDV